MVGMTFDQVIDVGRQAAQTMLMVASPMLILSLLVGLVIGMFQAMTQINESTLTFVPKIIAVVVAALIFSPWMLDTMLSLFTSILIGIPNYAH